MARITITGPTSTTQAETGAYVEWERMTIEQGNREVCQLAWSMTGFDRPTLDCSPAELDDAAHEAEAALNEVTPEGYFWHWHEGTFFLSADEEGDDLL